MEFLGGQTQVSPIIQAEILAFKKYKSEIKELPVINTVEAARQYRSLQLRHLTGNDRKARMKNFDLLNLDYDVPTSVGTVQ